MNGQAHWTDYGFQGGLCSAPAAYGGSSACQSAAAIAMGAGDHK
jgi:hypothetical protein